MTFGGNVGAVGQEPTGGGLISNCTKFERLLPGACPGVETSIENRRLHGEVGSVDRRQQFRAALKISRAVAAVPLHGRTADESCALNVEREPRAGGRPGRWRQGGQSPNSATPPRQIGVVGLAARQQEHGTAYRRKSSGAQSAPSLRYGENPLVIEAREVKLAAEQLVKAQDVSESPCRANLLLIPPALVQSTDETKASGRWKQRQRRVVRQAPGPPFSKIKDSDARGMEAVAWWHGVAAGARSAARESTVRARRLHKFRQTLLDQVADALGAGAVRQRNVCSGTIAGLSKFI